MTNFKNWMVALTLVMGISLTSCLSSDSDPIARGWAIAKCVNFYPPTFELENGQRMVLLTTFTTSFTPGDLYAVYYQFNTEEQAADSKELKVEAWNNLEPEHLNASYEEGPTDEPVEESAALYAFSGTVYTANGSTNIDPVVLFNQEFLVMSPVYWFKQVTGNDAQQEELKKHSFVITYDRSEIKEGDEELVLRINHVINENGGSTEVVRGTLASTTKAYSLASVKYDFEMIAKRKPARIKLVGKVNSSDDSLEKANEEVWNYTFK